MKLEIVLFGFTAFLGVAFSQQCLPDQFQCSNGNCAPQDGICDGYDDCGDASDEQQDCPPCPEAAYQCANGLCTDPYFICNGDDDCGDGSDEADENGNCPACPPVSFVCPNGKCVIRDYFTCDGIDHCGDGSDETEEACPCAEDEIRCSTGSVGGTPGKCIPPEWICEEEGIWDCPFGEDELNCTVRSVDTKPSNVGRVRPVILKETSMAALMKKMV